MQVRGEKVEITDKAGVLTVGTIVSLEVPGTTIVHSRDESDNPVTTSKPPAEPGIVNLLTEDGLEGVSLKTVKKIRFAKPELQAEFRKALEALALARGAATKAVGVTFAGQGERPVSVGYVAESPLWKPTWRVTLDGAAAKVQGWAAIENTTDEDWDNVKVSLVSGRPMTFQMDLYDPLFVPRPQVEPELYASLRPPVYQGIVPGPMQGGVATAGQLGGQLGMQGGVFGGFGGGGSAQNLGVGGGVMGAMGGGFGYTPLTRPSMRSLLGNRLQFDEFTKRSRGEAAESGAKRPANSSPTASADFAQSFQYDVKEPVSLPRFKSALLPVLNETITAERVSIYNPAVLGNHPLQGLRLTNKSKHFLAQGPVAVYDGGNYAGDSRLPDVKPGETRLLSFAIDLNTDITTNRESESNAVQSVKIASGTIQETVKFKRTTRYTLRNRSAEPRTVLLTQVAEDEWKLITPEKPAERTENLYRFEVKLAANAESTLDVTEERTHTMNTTMAQLGNDEITRIEKLPVASAAVKAALTKLRTEKTAMTTTEKKLADENAAMKAIVEDQARIRQNIERVPKESQAFQRYLKKFDDQETEMETRQSQVKKLTAELEKQRMTLAEYLKGISAE